VNGPDWTAMDRAEFDKAEPLVLFDAPDQSHLPRKPDAAGTPDLFESAEG
jgi:hypothetical protein